MESNITIKSNIYVRIHEDVRRDPDFVAHVSERRALKEIKRRYPGTLSGIQFSDWQRDAIREFASCANAKSREMTHGLVLNNDKIRYAGRCEYTDCRRFGICDEKAPYNRAIETVETPSENYDTPPLTHILFGISDVDDLFQIPPVEINECMPEEQAPPEAVIPDVKSFAAYEEFIKIDTPQQIIEADISGKILVNAAPGSGKTYTVIRRIEFIADNYLVDDISNVLVLVYTNAAKNEILTRLPYLAGNIDICTFDSLATSYLASINAQFTNLDYNSRIKLFNEKFTKEDFSNFEYVIVDELQDLVNERAKMTINILSAVNGGYLLLGDKCQAIYDYDCNEINSVNSVEFYNRLDCLFSEDVLRLELLGNKRQNQELSDLSNDIRCALLEFDPPIANELIADELKRIESMGAVERYNFGSTSKRTAILTRTNAQAEYISRLLNKKGVNHTLLRSGGQIVTLKRFIADCLWDYQSSSRLTRHVFTERYCARVSDNTGSAIKAFNALSEAVYKETRESIEMGKLWQALCNPTSDLPDFLLNINDSLLVVSTIHKAKGREFDTVFIVGSDFEPNNENTEEARVWYVAETRAKTEVYRMTINEMKYSSFKRSHTNPLRCMQLKNHKVKWTTQLKQHCYGVTIGLSSDFSETGFVKGSFVEALKMQEYIAHKIKTGDSLEIELVDKIYQFKHQGVVVGFLFNGMYSQLQDIACESNKRSNPPPYLSSVYVLNVITVTPSKFPDEVCRYFKDSNFWLGIEFSGFPIINWRYNEENKTTKNWASNAYTDWSALK